MKDGPKFATVTGLHSTHDGAAGVVRIARGHRTTHPPPSVSKLGVARKEGGTIGVYLVRVAEDNRLRGDMPDGVQVAVLLDIVAPSGSSRGGVGHNTA